MPDTKPLPIGWGGGHGIKGGRGNWRKRVGVGWLEWGKLMKTKGARGNRKIVRPFVISNVFRQEIYDLQQDCEAHS